MSVSMRLEPIARDVTLMINSITSGAGERYAEIAQEEIERAKEINRQALGRVPPFKIFVDGQVVTHLISVAPRSTIVTEFELMTDVLRWIGEQLIEHSPFLTGQYERSHKLFADGVEVTPSNIVPTADEYIFINVVPYARKLERGASSEAPDGIYQVVAALARRRFTRVSQITFTYRGVIGGNVIGGRPGNAPSVRQPAIIVKFR